MCRKMTQTAGAHALHVGVPETNASRQEVNSQSNMLKVANTYSKYWQGREIF